MAFCLKNTFVQPIYMPVTVEDDVSLCLLLLLVFPRLDGYLRVMGSVVEGEFVVGDWVCCSFFTTVLEE